MIFAILLSAANVAVAGSAASDARATPIGNTVIDVTPRIERPSSSTCVVTLFGRREFRGDSPLPITYRPPAGCRGRWAKVVLEADFDVSAGIQFDRTADVQLRGVTLFVGTTMEPGKDYAPHWHVERDVTNLAALLRTNSKGTASLTNYVDAKNTGHVFWSARLVFYAGKPKKAVADVVVPVTNGLTRVDAGKHMVSQVVTLPRNLMRLTLDLFAVGQGRDEFWFSCLPTRYTQPGAFWQTACAAPYREVEVRIDGALAGVQPVQPVIFTGGINPALWRRAPAIDALNLPAARIDLTPFAGLLNDGEPHIFALYMPDAGDYFRLSAVLLGQVDRHRVHVPGELGPNTLARARTETEQTESPSDPLMTGTLVTTVRRAEHVEGYVDTSKGRITTRVAYDSTMRLTDIRDTERSGQRYDARQTVTTTTRTPDESSSQVINEYNRLTINDIVSPPRHGVLRGTEISQTVERSTSKDGVITQSIVAFAPASSIFVERSPTPNVVDLRYRAEDGNRRCLVIEAKVSDDRVTRSSRTTCSTRAIDPSDWPIKPR